MKKFAYLTLFTKNTEGRYEYLIGQKKFLNLNDGYIGTNPNQYVIPGGNVMAEEDEQACAVREFEEETGFNLFDLGCDILIEVYSNKYAKFYLAEIPYSEKKNFIYDKNVIKQNGHYPEFLKFKWLSLNDSISHFKRKPKVDYLVNLYFENKHRFINNYKPSYLSEELYQCLINDYQEPVRDYLKKYITKRLDNDWFIKMFNKI